MPPNTFGRILLIVFGIILTCAPFLVIFLGEALSLPVASFLYKTGTSWLIIFLYLLLIFLLFDAVRMTHWFPMEKYIYNNWLTLSILIVALGTITIWGYFNYLQKEKVELSIVVHKKTENIDTLKIIAISDLHLGYSIGKREFENWVNLINKEQPDLILIAGDIIDNSVRPLYEKELADVFKKMKARYGIYAVLGNHEYIADVSKSIEFLEHSGVRLLRDSAVLIEDEFYIIGRDDRMNENRNTLETLMMPVDQSKPIILLDHQPFNLEKAEENGIDLQISGHTHDGQIFPLSLITKWIYEKSHGYLKKGNTHIYVTSGLGIWGGKFRIGTRSEYVVIKLLLEN